jgi:hypothetical protein
VFSAIPAMQDIRFLYTSQLFGWFFDYFATMLHNRFYSFSRFCHQDTKAQSFILFGLIGFEQSARHKVSFTPIYRYTSYKNNCHSPDGSGNPFVSAFATKDCSAQQEIAPYSNLQIPNSKLDS